MGWNTTVFLLAFLITLQIWYLFVSHFRFKLVFFIILLWIVFPVRNFIIRFEVFIFIKIFFVEFFHRRPLIIFFLAFFPFQLIFFLHSCKLPIIRIYIWMNLDCAGRLLSYRIFWMIDCVTFQFYLSVVRAYHWVVLFFIFLLQRSQIIELAGNGSILSRIEWTVVS